MTEDNKPVTGNTTKGKKLEHDFSGIGVGQCLNFDISKDPEAAERISRSLYQYKQRHLLEWVTKVKTVNGTCTVYRIA